MTAAELAAHRVWVRLIHRVSARGMATRYLQTARELDALGAPISAGICRDAAKQWAKRAHNETRDRSVR